MYNSSVTLANTANGHQNDLNIQDNLFLWLKRFSQRKEACLMPIGITVNHYVTLTRNV